MSDITDSDKKKDFSYMPVVYLVPLVDVKDALTIRKRRQQRHSYIKCYRG